MGDHQPQAKQKTYPGVAQLGARVVWDHQAAGSIPVTRTKPADLITISRYFYTIAITILY